MTPFALSLTSSLTSSLTPASAVFFLSAAAVIAVFIFAILVNETAAFFTYRRLRRARRHENRENRTAEKAHLLGHLYNSEDDADSDVV